MSPDKVRFLMINPTSPLWRVKANQRPVNSGVFRFSMLPSLYVAASMPGYVETKILDEDVEPVDFSADADLVGISFMTYNAPRAYEIADTFRSLGKKVIELSAEENARWAEVVSPVADTYIKAAEKRGLPGKQYVDAVRQMVQKYSN